MVICRFCNEDANNGKTHNRGNCRKEKEAFDWSELIHRRVDLHYKKWGKEPECIPMTELEFKALEQEVEKNTAFKEIRDKERKRFEERGIEQIHFFEGIQIKIV